MAGEDDVNPALGIHVIRYQPAAFSSHSGCSCRHVLGSNVVAIIELHTLGYCPIEPLGGVEQNDLPEVSQYHECSGFTKNVRIKRIRPAHF